MKSVCTMALSVAVSLAAGDLWAQSPYSASRTSVSALPDSPSFVPAGHPAYRTARMQPSAGDDVAPMPMDDMDMPPAPTVSDEPAPPRQVNVPGQAAPVVEPGCGAYDQAMSGEWSDDCGLPTCCAPRWFGSVAGLVMTRDNTDRFWTSYEMGNEPNQLLNSKDADFDWSGGVEARIGRCFGCGNNKAWEAIYWGVYGLDGSASVTHPNGVGTPFDSGEVYVSGIETADAYFDNAAEHRIRRESDFHNVELNIIHNPIECAATGCCGPRGNISFLGGFRYFRFEDYFSIGSVRGGSSFGDNGGADEIYLDTELTNNLYGFQIGARGDYRLGSRFGVFASPKVGVFGNDINKNTRLYRGDDLTVFDIDADKEDVAILAQLDVGANYQVSQRWSIFGGYRAVAASGVALADDQTPQFLRDYPAYEDVNSNGEVILHGAFAGIEARF